MTAHKQTQSNKKHDDCALDSAASAVSAACSSSALGRMPMRKSYMSDALTASRRSLVFRNRSMQTGKPRTSANPGRFFGNSALWHASPQRQVGEEGLHCEAHHQRRVCAQVLQQNPQRMRKRRESRQTTTSRSVCFMILRMRLSGKTRTSCCLWNQFRGRNKIRRGLERPLPT